VTNNYQSGALDSHVAARLALPETVSVALEDIAADMEDVPSRPRGVDEQWGEPLHPAIDCDVIDLDAPFGM
jgi:hypothetical protein